MNEKQSKKTFIAAKNFLSTDLHYQHTRATETNTSQLEHYRQVDANLPSQRTHTQRVKGQKGTKKRGYKSDKQKAPILLSGLFADLSVKLFACEVISYSRLLVLRPNWV
ncbi:MAG: hypothetical protein QMB40_03105, partial [Aeromonadaceae bacterium]